MENMQLLNAGQIYDHFFPLEFGGTLADLGCGTMAFFSYEAAKRLGNKGTVYAVDIQKSVVETVRDRSKVEGFYNLVPIWSDLESPGTTAKKIGQSELDYAVLSTTLWQCTNHKQVLIEAFSLLKSQGKLLFIDWQAGLGPIGPAKEKRLQPEYIERLAKEVGFTLEKDFQASSAHYGRIFVKP